MEERKKDRLNGAANGPETGNREDGMNLSRRRALKTIAAGGAIAGGLAMRGKWTRPVVDTILLPAHAQATNATAPVTTTPAPATTTCSTRLASADFDTHRDNGGYYDQPVRVYGTITPAAAGQTVQVHLGILYDGGTAYVYRDYTATTDASGSWSVTENNYAGGISAEATITGPCGDTRDISDTNQGGGVT
jgi:hypothetical protein